MKEVITILIIITIIYLFYKLSKMIYLFIENKNYKFDSIEYEDCNCSECESNRNDLLGTCKTLFDVISDKLLLKKSLKIRLVQTEKTALDKKLISEVIDETFYKFYDENNKLK